MLCGYNAGLNWTHLNSTPWTHLNSTPCCSAFFFFFWWHCTSHHIVYYFQKFWTPQEGQPKYIPQIAKPCYREMGRSLTWMSDWGKAWKNLGYKWAVRSCNRYSWHPSIWAKKTKHESTNFNRERWFFSERCTSPCWVWIRDCCRAALSSEVGETPPAAAAQHPLTVTAPIK